MQADICVFLTKTGCRPSPECLVETHLFRPPLKARLLLMITAFGTALLDSIAGPMRSYTIAKDGERALHLTCEEYITLRTDEEASPWTSSI
jgi:hypothetical protein